MISDKNLSIIKAINFTGNNIGDSEIELLVPILQKLANLNSIDFTSINESFLYSISL